MTSPTTCDQPPTALSSQASARLHVDLDAVAENTRTLAARTSARLMAVVKADGFGHGAADVARTALAHGASSLGVTSVAEGLALRDAGLEAPVLSWLNPVDTDFEPALVAGIDLAVPSLSHLRAVARAAHASRPPARVHLHADVGMARDGESPHAWGRLCTAAREAEDAGLVDVVAIMGHLGCAENPGDPSTTVDLRAYERAVRAARRAGLRPRTQHLAATAATLTDPRTHLDLCRVGAGLVGIDPSGTTRLRHALTLTAPVVSVRDVGPGTRVGYGHSYLTPSATRLALLPVGYADGLPRAASAHGQVMVGGRRCPVVGLVSMDQTVVDVGDLPVRPGDTAVVLGPGTHGEPTTADWARWAMTIEHEIVTGFGPRLVRTVSHPHVTDEPVRKDRA